MVLGRRARPSVSDLQALTSLPSLLVGSFLSW